MNVVVLSKFVPNPEGVPEMGDDFLLKREGVEGVLDPGDEFGVEAGLQLAEATGGEVTVVSMGPEAGATEAVRKALSMGAAKGVLDHRPAAARAPTRSSPRRSWPRRSSGPGSTS